MIFSKKNGGDILMKRVAVVTDSNSGITQAKAAELKISVLPMPFFINGEQYLEDINMSQSQFYEALKSDAEIHTSQPSPGDVTDLWDSVLASYDELVYIPMSSGLSGSCHSAELLSRDYNGRVEVVDNQRISVTQYQSVLDALKLAGEGKSAAEIKSALLANKFNSSIYITVETLKYLKKGGRITPVAAAIGELLKIKPVLQIQGEKLDAYSKVRGKKAARTVMINAMKKDLVNRFPDAVSKGTLRLELAYSGNEEEALDWKKECEAAFPGYEFLMAPLSLSVSCHIGYGALAIACSVAL